MPALSAPVLPTDNPDALARAADILAGGGLVAVPTETVYGLAADATNPEAVARIYAAKGRPSFNPLIAHVADAAMARTYGALDDDAETLARAFWPGPLTLVVPIARSLAPAVHAGLATVALRHAPGTMAALSARLGRPLAAPSANPSGRLSPTTAAHVIAGLGDRVGLVLDGGPCGTGLESTIVAGDRVLRPGAISADAIAAVLGRSVRAAGGGIEAPGMMASHYAPRAAVRLNARKAEPDELLLGFGRADGALNLSPSGDLTEAARNLYAMLADLDARTPRIAVAPVPERGIGVAINDRLRRAATPSEA